MTIDINAPAFPESVSEGTVATWHKSPGDSVMRDELIVDIETDKVVLEVLAPAAGVLSSVVKGEGEVVLSGEQIGILEEGEGAASPEPVKAEKPEPEQSSEDKSSDERLLSPAARKLVEENSLDVAAITGSGKGGRITKEDVLGHLKERGSQDPGPAASSLQASQSSPDSMVIDQGAQRLEKRVPMTRLRARVAERLMDAKNNTAMLTTFNEVDMGPIMSLRKKYGEEFEKRHNGTRLGFMSFFVRASVEALKRFPVVNASIDGNDIVYHGYQDVGVAVSTDRGLVVPVLRNTDSMSLADIEQGIRELGLKARDGKLSIDDMTGGTFTITNGGVFGSLLSTPILNPPQTAILGMHKIQERPVAVNGEVVVQPMMYLALSYDHRLVDGKEAVQFLVEIKELLEEPARILLDL